MKLDKNEVKKFINVIDENNQVKIALFKNGGADPVVGPKLVSELADSQVRGGSKVLYETSNDLTGTSVTDSYVMKIWVDYDVKIEEELLTEQTYKLLVNVDSTVEHLQ